jgi:hypothetical protein
MPEVKKCDESCNKSDPLHVCSHCGACLFKNGFKQIPDEMYPLFECLTCHEVVFWD